MTSNYVLLAGCDYKLPDVLELGLMKSDSHYALTNRERGLCSDVQGVYVSPCALSVRKKIFLMDQALGP